MSAEARPWDGSKITEPGIYTGIPMSAYHGDLCDGPSVSSSSIRAALVSPYDYWAYSPFNPDAFPREEKKTFDFGTAVHLLVLGDEPFADHFEIVPTGVLAKNGSTNTAAYRAWAATLDGKRPMKESELVNVQLAAQAVGRHPDARAILDGIIEASLIWRDPVTGLWIKARPDVLPTDSSVVDLKTIANADYRDILRAITNHGYHVQMACIAEGKAALMGAFPETFAFVFVQSTAPFHVFPVGLDPHWVEVGAKDLRRGIDLIAKGFETGEWPGRAERYGTTIPQMPVPDWMLKQEEHTT